MSDGLLLGRLVTCYEQGRIGTQRFGLAPRRHPPKRRAFAGNSSGDGAAGAAIGSPPFGGRGCFVAEMVRFGPSTPLAFCKMLQSH